MVQDCGYDSGRGVAGISNGGGWVRFVFHRLCEQCGPYAITPAKFTAFLDLLQGEVAGGRVVVQTTAQVIGGPVQLPVPR